MYTNIDYAIATVKERGHALTVSNVLAAYIQCVYAHATPEDAADSTTVAQAARISFERAMDKYPAPAPPSFARTKGAKERSANTSSSSKNIIEAGAIIELECCGRPFCSEVAQLREEYRKALWRVSDTGSGSCTCPSCGSLLRADEVRKLSPDEEDNLRSWNGTASLSDQRTTRKTKKVVKKKTRKAKKVPFDPYAPSTSRITS
ncbi:hypothetical protein BN946_scf184970.g134 [Trametes cinnabarina]|uniref:Uncharacterized protein n=1 Tax=Pycnoporus cinnabarinus TaxID=5643 RepID=A0A060SCU7_PYCCI|nr:hypothetical protein BN946_scf184970.g134 [Trametes cinnabarina]